NVLGNTVQQFYATESSPLSGESGLQRVHREPWKICQSADERPSLRSRISFTTCGFALPDVDFMTCPTNQPASCGFAFACSTLSGLAAITASIAASMAPVSVT